MRRFSRRLMLGLFVVFLFPTLALADIGVGVGTGKIYVDEGLRAGVLYDLPELTVLNTGDVASDYDLSIEFHENQEEMRPDPAWFHFSPSKFYLEPGGTQLVSIRLNLPLKVQPGDYFAFVSAHPVVNVESGETIVGVAAASKLYFTIHPANVFQAMYYRIVTFWQTYPKLMNGLVIAVIASGAVLASKKYLNIDIKLKKSDKETKE